MKEEIKKITEKYGTIVGTLCALIFVALITLILALPLMWLWNAIIPQLLSLPTITYWQACGLFLICDILFKGSSE